MIDKGMSKSGRLQPGAGVVAGTHKQQQRHNESTNAREVPDPIDTSASADSAVQQNFDLLKTSIQSWLTKMHKTEAANQQQESLLQKRMEGLYDREQQVLQRETALSQMQQQVHAEQGALAQCQSELKQQYTCLMSSLPLLQERLANARQSIPECSAAVDSLHNSHASLAMLSHELLRRQPTNPAQPSSAEPDNNLYTSQRNENGRQAQQWSQQNKNGCAHRQPATSMLQPDHRTDVQAQPQSQHMFANKRKDQLPAASAGAVHAAGAAAESAQAELPQAVTASSAKQAIPPQSSGTVPPWEQLSAAASAGVGQASQGQAQSVGDAAAQKPQHGPSVNMANAAMPISKVSNSAQQHAQSASIGAHSKPNHAAPTLMGNGAHAAQAHSYKSTPNFFPNVSAARVDKPISNSKQAGQGAAGSASHPLVIRTKSQAAGDNSSPRTAAPATLLGSPNASGGADSAKLSSELGSPSGSGRGRGRIFGGRYRRGRSRSHVAMPRAGVLAGDLDEAVQALKATTTGTDSPRSNTDDNPHSASGTLTDDDLKPAFMRRLASDKLQQADAATASDEARLMGAVEARQGGTVDINPRPATRRRLDPAATAVLKTDAPDLLELLQQKGLADDINMLDTFRSNPDDDQHQAGSVYDTLHTILSKVCDGQSGSSWQGRGLNAGKVTGPDGQDKHAYCLLALEHLVERAHAYSSNCKPVKWGWSSANRIVVEKPNYGHATYFFDLEEPLPVADQVRRLIAVLSVPGVSRRNLLEGTSSDPGQNLTPQEQKPLEAAGWTPGTTIRSLLNFSGDRIFHQSADIMAGQKSLQQHAPDYKEKIARVLSEGASGGRITKARHTMV